MIKETRKGRGALRATLLAATAAVTVSMGGLMSVEAAEGQTLLLRDPAISGDTIAFVYAGDIWVANVDGANPRRLTASLESEMNPVFSPDGSMIAYSVNHDNNWDVHVIPTAGGQPRRLTFHPGSDTVMDWAPDGSAIAFSSSREREHGRSAQLYHVSLNGGLPVRQMRARIQDGSYNADASRFAYIDHLPAYNALYGFSSAWRGYRGGASPSVTLYDMKADKAIEIPGDRVNDLQPMWVGDTVYFLSDRDDKTLNIHRFNASTGAVEKVSDEAVWDIRAADADGTRIIYEAGGRLKLLDTASGGVREIEVSIRPDLPQRRPQWKDASRTVTAASLSPSGARVALTARGDVFTVPVKDGTTRNLTRTAGGREYTALWSADGQHIAYIDAKDEAQVLVLADQMGEVQKRFPLGDGFNFLAAWGKGQIAYTNNRLELWVIDSEDGSRTLVSTGARREQVELAFSQDGSWLAFTQEQPNFNRSLMLYNVADGTAHTVADRFADAGSPAFSADGAYLYFTAATNSGPAQVGLDMSSQERPYRAGLYAAVLSADGKSPLAPKTGDEKPKTDKGKKDKDAQEADAKDEKATEKPSMQVDVEGLTDRIVALPVGERNYGDLTAGKDGALYYVQGTQPGNAIPGAGQSRSSEFALMRFDFKDRKASKLMSGVTGLSVSGPLSHLLIQKGNSWHVAPVGKKLDAKPLKLGDVRMHIDPMDEWVHLFDEAWRMEKHYFYDPAMHGLDWQAIYERYRPLVEHAGRRRDVADVIREMIAEMQVGHNRSGGGDVHTPKSVSPGLLGANFAFENGKTRITRLYTGESWNPQLQAPLAAPGLGISEGDYILAVNGQTLSEKDNIFAFLEGTAGKQVTLTVASEADGSDAREAVVKPTANEFWIRLWAWIEANRRAVDAATDGKVGYVYLPNTAGAGYTLFNRMFFSQVDKEAMIIDERSNGGGQAANYITDVLSRTYLSGWKDSVGLVYNTPGGAMYGPKVMLIDQDAGSGGDFLPYSFRQMGIGPLIGTRTWGGLIGIRANPNLMDGAFLTVPNFRYFDPNGKWTIENEGVAPDIEVALDPVMTNQGRDSQLEAAIAEVMKRLAANPSPVPTEAPAYPTEVGQ